MKKYKLRITAVDENGKRLHGVAVVVKRRGKEFKIISPGSKRLRRGRYRIASNDVNAGGVWYTQKRKPLKVKLNKNKAVWIWYKRMPMIPSHVPDEFVSMFNAINAVRGEHGAPPVEYQATLGAVAQSHAFDIAAHDSASHISSNGDTFDKRVRKSSYLGDPAGEIIATGTVGVGGTIQAWKNSSQHYAAMINPEFNHVGIGLYTKYYENYSTPTDFWVVDFGYDPAS